MTPLGGAGGSLRDQGRLPDAGLAGDQRRPGLPTLRGGEQLVDALELSGTAGEADVFRSHVTTIGRVLPRRSGIHEQGRPHDIPTG